MFDQNFVFFILNGVRISVTLATTTISHQVQSLSTDAPNPHFTSTNLPHWHCDSNSHRQFTIATSVLSAVIDTIKTGPRRKFVRCTSCLEQSATDAPTDVKHRLL